jgi:phage terminase large subunit GpA-like protein
MLDFNQSLDYTWTPAEQEIFKPKPKIKVSELAAQIRIVTRGPAQGLWTNEFAPYLVEPMDTWNLPWVRKIFICFAPQMGKTQIALNCLLYCVVIDPGDAFYIMPDQKVMQRIMNRQIVPMLRATPESAALLGDNPSSHDISSLKASFLNGMELMAAWATYLARCNGVRISAIHVL